MKKTSLKERKEESISEGLMNNFITVQTTKDLPLTPRRFTNLPFCFYSRPSSFSFSGGALPSKKLESESTDYLLRLADNGIQYTSPDKLSF